MKKIILFLLISTSFTVLNAKMVKFSVDMFNEVLDSGGIHITGDFQEEAGYPGGDWLPNTTEMLNEPGTTVFSVVVNIPAFQKFEYKFINGSGTYGLEFVPVESRVDDVINDNRWIFIDSLDSDTMEIGAIVFSGNAPQGKYLLRHKVNMEFSVVPSAGVHVQGSYQNWNPAITRLYSFDGNIYQYIAYIDTGNIAVQYNYVNGNTTPDAETVPTACAVTTNKRGLTLTTHTVLAVVCFAKCIDCPIGIASVKQIQNIQLFPNPMQDKARIVAKDNQLLQEVSLLDLTGKVIRSYKNISNPSLEIEKNDLQVGVYMLMVKDVKGNASVLKCIIE